jgi:predicted nuclease of predicted toxin-antitoxin system
VKFKLDENLPGLIRTTLVGLGHDAQTVTEEKLAGATDDAVLQASIAERRVLITLDLDFGDIRTYPPGSHAGIWALRPAVQTFRAIESLVLAGLRLTGTERIHGQLWVIDAQRVRIRDA